MFYNAIMKPPINVNVFLRDLSLLLISYFLAACAAQQHMVYPAFTTFQDPIHVTVNRAKNNTDSGPTMVVLPPGQFLMGSPLNEPSRSQNEGPQHRVTITKPFAISQYAITFKEYDAFVTATNHTKPSDTGWGSERWGRITTPVFNVSWHDAQQYIAWLSKQTGKQYRLPTEAEWEYAARAGTSTPFSTGDCLSTDQANFHGRNPYGECPVNKLYRGKVIAVGTFAANPWGLYDMHGNLFEWTEDCWHENYVGAPADGTAWIDNVFVDKTNGDLATKPCRTPSRVLRGGSWSGYEQHLRSAYRAANNPGFKSIFIGFRVVREL